MPPQHHLELLQLRLVPESPQHHLAALMVVAQAAAHSPVPLTAPSGPQLIQAHLEKALKLQPRLQLPLLMLLPQLLLPPHLQGDPCRAAWAMLLQPALMALHARVLLTALRQVANND